MRKLLVTLAFAVFALASFSSLRYFVNFAGYGAPPYVEERLTIPNGLERFPELLNWERPEGPLRVGLQVGHWKNDELPDELMRIRDSGGGTSGLGVMEWEVNLEVARETAKILENEGIEVDILPSTVPKNYWADVFVAIHADGSLDPATSGFKVASGRRDFTDKADDLVNIIEENYSEATGFEIDPNVTRNMTGYYAFSWWRYDHAVHPMATSVILETGFMTNTKEARILINNPEIPAAGLANSLIEFLK